MRKLYSLLLALVATCIYTTAALADISLTINVDDATRVAITNYDTGETLAIQNGDNIFTCADDQSLYLKVTTTSSDYALKSVTGTMASGATESVYVYDNSASISLFKNEWDNTDGAVYTVVSYSVAALRTDTCVVNVDNASKARLVNASYKDIPLVDGENKIAFIPASQGNIAETPFTAGPKSGRLYKVLLNKAEVVFEYGAYDLDVKHGDTVDIISQWPDKDVPVQFIAGNEGTETFISKVTVDNQEVTNWNEANFTVKLGSELAFFCNTTDYKIDSVFVNGEKKSVYGRVDLFIDTEEAQTIKYYASKYATYNITVNVDHADRVALKKYVGYNQVDIALVDGTNTVEISETVTGLTFTKAKSGCTVTSFVDQDGTEYKDYPDQWKSIPVKEGAVYTITTTEVSREASFVYYIDNPAAANQGGTLEFVANDGDNLDRTTIFTLKNNDGTYAEGGYYTYEFFDPTFDNPLQINAWADEELSLVIYQQDTIVTLPEYGSPRISIADKDVVKIYLAGAPDTLDVTFTIEGEGTPTVLRDLIVPVEKLDETLHVLTGTQIDITALSVKVNGKDVVANENGVFSVTITEDSQIAVTTTTTTIENVRASLNRNVYNLQGMLLIKDATPAQINALPAGLYIINGKTSYLLQH